jgi:hypothetical protein
LGLHFIHKLFRILEQEKVFTTPETFREKRKVDENRTNQVLEQASQKDKF